MNQNEEVKKNLVKLISTFNDKRIISEGDIKEVLAAIVAILKENKKAVDTLADETKQSVEQALETLDVKTQENIKAVLKSLESDYKAYQKNLEKGSQFARADIEKATKEQNDRAFKRLQTLIASIKMPKDGVNGKDGLPGIPGKDGSPDEPKDIRDKLETLTGTERLDASAIKGLPDYFKTAKKAGRQMLVGGIRFFENLVDVSILPSIKREDLLVQYSKTNNRWENGIALTVSTTEPTNPQELDVWIDTN